MLNRLKKKLIIEYTVFSAVILTIGLLVAVYMLTEQKKETFAEHFTQMVSGLAEDIETGMEISLWEISGLEAKNDAFVYMEENGDAMDIPEMQSETEKTELIEKAQNRFFEEYGDLKKHPENMTGSKAEQMIIRGAHGEKYETYCALLPEITQEKRVSKISGYRFLVVMQSRSSYERSCRKIRLGFLLLDGLGVLLFAFLSAVYVNKILKPAEEANERQNRFVNAVSHELRAPLAVIRVSNASSEEPSEVIEKECVRMAKLIEDMILLAGFNGRTWKINMAEADLDSILLDTYDAYEPVCREKGLKLELRVGEELLPKAFCDEIRIRQVLAILLNNAVAYTVAGDSMVLSGREEGGKLVVSVTDHGPGIPEQEKKKIFEQFYRGDASRTDSSHMGLGLSIANEIVKLQGGSIAVRDTEGGGATFEVTLRKMSDE